MLRVLLLAAALTLPAAAQDASPVLTLDQDRLFLDSAFGRRIADEVETRSAELTAENREIETALVAEEGALTAQRADLAAEQFRPLAEDFDRRVKELRAAQDAKAREIEATGERARAEFFGRIAGVLTEVVRGEGAVAILDRRAIVLALDSIDITDEAIAAVDAAIGDGAD